MRAFVALDVPVGPPVFVKEYLDTKLNKLEALFTAIDGLDDAQVQLYLITRSMSICRVTHLMRCLPPTPELTAFITSYSNMLRRSLTNLLNREEMSDASWRQAQLKYSEAGLGLGNPLITRDAAFISSVSSSMQLALGFMDRSDDGQHGVFDATSFEPMLEEAVTRYNDELPAEAPRYDARTLPYGLRQEALSAPLMEAEYEAVEASFNLLADNERLINIARVRSCRSSESSAFLTAVPNENFKTKMISSHFRVAVELRLGILHCVGRRCAFGCGAVLDANGAHATSCKASGMAKGRHDHVKETLGNVMRQSGMNVEFEPRGLIAANGRLKPADVSVSGLSSSGIFTSVDVTIPCPTCPRISPTVRSKVASHRSPPTRRCSSTTESTTGSKELPWKCTVPCARPSSGSAIASSPTTPRSTPTLIASPRRCRPLMSFRCSVSRCRLATPSRSSLVLIHSSSAVSFSQSMFMRRQSSPARRCASNATKRLACAQVLLQ